MREAKQQEFGFVVVWGCIFEGLVLVGWGFLCFLGFGKKKGGGRGGIL